MSTATAGISAVTIADDAAYRCPICGGAAVAQREVLRAGAVGECGSCGAWFRVPRPTLDDLLKIYGQGYYDAWGLDQGEAIAETTKKATFAPLLRRLTAVVEKRDGRRLLDVGAATGLLLEVAQESGFGPYAVELNPFAAQVLRERFGAERVFEGELTACGFEAGSFDAVTMTDLIEHVLDVGTTLTATRRLLRPGGVLCITTPRIDSFSRRAMGRNWLHFKLEHIQYFSAKSMESSLRQAGFERIEIHANTKRLSLDYLRRQLRTYPHWALSPIVGALHRVAPRGLREQPMSYRCGEMLVFARRPQEAAA